MMRYLQKNGCLEPGGTGFTDANRAIRSSQAPGNGSRADVPRIFLLARSISNAVLLTLANAERGGAQRLRTTSKSRPSAGFLACCRDPERSRQPTDPEDLPRA